MNAKKKTSKSKGAGKKSTAKGNTAPKPVAEKVLAVAPETPEIQDIEVVAETVVPPTEAVELTETVIYESGAPNWINPEEDNVGGNPEVPEEGASESDDFIVPEGGLEEDKPDTTAPVTNAPEGTCEQCEDKGPTGEELLNAYLASEKKMAILKQARKGGNFVDKMDGEIYVPISVVKLIIAAN